MENYTKIGTIEHEVISPFEGLLDNVNIVEVKISSRSIINKVGVWLVFVFINFKQNNYWVVFFMCIIIDFAKSINFRMKFKFITEMYE